MRRLGEQVSVEEVLSAFKKGVGAQEETPPSQAGQPGDAAKPITAETTTTPPGGQVRQDSAAKV